MDPLYQFEVSIKDTKKLREDQQKYVLSLYLPIQHEVLSLRAQNESLKQKLKSKRGEMFPAYEVSALQRSSAILLEIADVIDAHRKERG